MRSPVRWRVGLCLWAVLAAAPGARAQERPHIGYIYPAGGRQGTVAEIAVGGQYLAGATGAHVSGKGVRTKVVRYTRALTNSQLNQLGMKLAEVRQFQVRAMAATNKGSKAGLLMVKAAEEFTLLAARLGLKDPTPKGYAELRKKLADPKRQPNPQLGETVILEITVAPDAEPGERELRLETPAGVTNPLYLHVGQDREYREQEPNDQTPDSGVLTGRRPTPKVELPKLSALPIRADGLTISDAEPPPPRPDPPKVKPLPVVVNGQVLPGDVDRFRFKARKGTRLVAAVSAQRLVPYLADAVPGWFQATLRLLDAKGNELAYSDDFRFHPDPVLHYEVPHDGEFVLEIQDSIFRGREDFVYRITVGEVPFLTSIFPLGGRAGQKTTVQVTGWNLSAATLTVDSRGRVPRVVDICVANGKRVSNRLPFALDTLPERLEAEPNNHRARAQRLTLPIIVNGRIDRPGDWDCFRFDGRAGQEIVAEVHARRLESPLDSLLKLTDAAGKLLAANDDHVDKGAGLTTHQADSRLAVKLPADGTYLLHLGDTQHKGGRAYAYRLRIAPRQPDFALRVVPSSLSAGPGATVPMAVHALRKDGFAGEITLRLTDAPRGLRLSGARIPAGQDQIRLTLTVPPTARTGLLRPSLEGRAVIRGREVVRTAVAAEDMMQAFLYRHLVATKDWTVTITGRRRTGPALTRVGGETVKLPAGGTAQVRLAAPKATPAKQFQVTLSEPPKGIAIRKVSPDPKGLTILLGADANDAKPGLKGNLILTAAMDQVWKSRDGQRTGTRRIDLGPLPAIPFQILPPGPGGK